MLLATVFAASLAGSVSPAPPPSGSAPAGARMAPLDAAIAHYRDVNTYRVTIHSHHADGEELIRYFFKKPGYVRMEFIKPHHGALLVYDPETRRVRLWPFGYGHFPELNLAPDSFLIRSPRGEQVDHSDIGALFENMIRLQNHGKTEVLGEELLDGRKTLHTATTGTEGYAVEGVHHFELWLDEENWFPLKVVSKDGRDAVLETVLMSGPVINEDMPDELFKPGKKK